MINQNYSTSFVNSEGASLGDYPGLLPIPLYKGMEVTIHSYPAPFVVVDWSFHHGHPDEKAGLKIVLK